MIHIYNAISSFLQLELGYNPIGPEGAKALAEVLKFHGNIKVLMLGWCQVRTYTYESLPPFVEIFHYILYVQLLQIGATGAEYIADMLRYNSTISSLDLRANGLRDEVCLIIFVFEVHSCHSFILNIIITCCTGCNMPCT